jgi:chromosome segregation ATPase
MDSKQLIFTLIINAVVTPIIALITLSIKNSFDRTKHRDQRDDNFIAGMEKRIKILETEIKEVRVELKNRDAEYLDLYKNYTTLKAKYEVLEADHEALKFKYEQTVEELKRLGTSSPA